MTADLSRYQQLSLALARFEQNRRLEIAENFVERLDAIDLLEFDLFGALIAANGLTAPNAETVSLTKRAEALKQRLDDANSRLFSALRAAIRANDRAEVRRYFQETAHQVPAVDDSPGYDALDMLVSGLLEIDDVPEETAARETDLIFYQPTPARIVLRLVEVLQPTADDLFYDLGSGLGHVPILMHLLTGVRARGVELEASYCRYASRCARNLGLTGVTFIHTDAREADFSKGTIFYMYTPFQGEVLRQVLGRLAQEAEQRLIRVCAYGPCTAQVARQPWLQPLLQTGTGETRFGIFSRTPFTK